MSQQRKFFVSKIYLPILISLFAATCGFGQSVESLVLSHLERTRSYDGLCFEYTSVEKKGDGPELVLENELSIFAPIDKRSSQTRRMWISKRKNPGEPWDPDDEYLVHFFCGFNGRESRVFTRNYSAKGSLTTLHHTAGVTVQDQLDYNNNRLEEFLTGGPHMITEYRDPAGKFILEQLPGHLSLTAAGEVMWKNRKGLRLFREGKDGWEAILDKATGNIPLMISGFLDGQLIIKLESFDVAEFEGIKYVKSGEISSEAIGQLESEYYSFTVNRVRRVSPNDVFWPEWPLGTVAGNEAGERVVSNPYPPERRDAVRTFWENTESGSGGWYWAVLTALILATIVGILVYRRKYAK